jgi:hypothetical protein
MNLVPILNTDRSDMIYKSQMELQNGQQELNVNQQTQD